MESIDQVKSKSKFLKYYYKEQVYRNATKTVYNINKAGRQPTNSVRIAYQLELSDGKWTIPDNVKKELKQMLPRKQLAAAAAA